MDIILRPSRRADLDGLKKLWKMAFGDSDIYINDFFEHFGENSSFVAERDGSVVSGIHLLPAGYFFNGEGKRLNCVYAYALATMPEYRNMGLASAVVKASIDSSLESYDCNIICPAGLGLFPFYEGLGYSKFFSVKEIHFSPETMPNKKTDMILTKVDAYSYISIRRRIQPKTTVEYEKGFLAYQEKVALRSKGGFFVFKTQNAELGCATIEKAADRRVCVKELLLPEHLADDGLSCIKTAFPASSYLVRCPGADGVDISRPFALAVFRGKNPTGIPEGYFSFVLD